MLFKLIVLPVIGGLIGWLTNLIAIKLIFRPHTPYKIPFIGIYLYGLIPKRKAQLAESIGRVVEKELLPAEEISRRIKEMQLKNKIQDILLKITQERVEEKMAFLPSGVRQAIGSFTKNIFSKELDRVLDHFFLKIEEQVLNESKLGEIVEERINNYKMQELENLVLSVVSKELKHIELLGGILGFTIGLFQAIILIFLES